MRTPRNVPQNRPVVHRRADTVTDARRVFAVLDGRGVALADLLDAAARAGDAVVLATRRGFVVALHEPRRPRRRRRRSA